MDSFISLLAMILGLLEVRCLLGLVLLHYVVVSRGGVWPSAVFFVLEGVSVVLYFILFRSLLPFFDGMYVYVGVSLGVLFGAWRHFSESRSDDGP